MFDDFSSHAAWRGKVMDFIGQLLFGDKGYYIGDSLVKFDYADDPSETGQAGPRIACLFLIKRLNNTSHDTLTATVQGKDFGPYEIVVRKITSA